MSVTRSDLEDAYAKGQRDGANNDYKPPLSWLKGAAGFANEDELALKDSYDKGYEHGRSQR